MKSLEERYNAWIDGELPEAEAARLEAELGGDPAALRAERQSIRHLGGLLREHLEAPALANAGFFNHQLMQRIAAQTPAPAPARPFWQRVGWRLALSTALGGAVAALALVALTRETTLPDTQPYQAHLMETEPGEPGISAVAIQAGDEKLAVVWIDGLDYVPADPKALTTGKHR